MSNNSALQQSTYSSTIGYHWSQDGHLGTITRVSKNAHHLIIGYELKEVPQFDEQSNNNANDQYKNNLLRQKTFIDTVFSLFLVSPDDLKSSLELRITNNPTSKKISCYLLLRYLTEYNVIESEILKFRFEGLIPEDYFLQPMGSASVLNLLALGEKTIVEIRKETNFLPVGNTYVSETVMLPAINAFPLKEGDNFHIPCSQYIEFSEHNWLGFYKILQEAEEPLQLRVSLSTLSVFDTERSLAYDYYQIIKQAYSNVPNLDINNFLASHNKYLTNANLFSIKIQLAGDTESSTLAVANAFCTHLAYGRIKPNLICFSLANILKKDLKQDWEACNHAFYPPIYPSRTISNLNDILNAFILRLPYMSDQGEAAAIFRLPTARSEGLPGILTSPIRPFYQPSQRPKTGGKVIELGSIVTQNKSFSKDNSSNFKYTIPIQDLTKHGLIVGATGSGKTNTTLNFVKELAKNGIPFLLIEPVKSEYFDKLSPYFKEGELNRFNFKKPFNTDGSCNHEFFRFNPFIPIEGISAIQHISYIKSCFNAAFPMNGIMPMLLEECLYDCYYRALNGNQRNLFTPSSTPKYFHHLNRNKLNEEETRILDFLDIEMLYQIVNKYLENEELFDDEDRGSLGAILKRRIKTLTKGILGNSINPNLWRTEDDEFDSIPNNIDTIFTKPTIIELESLADNDEKALVMAFLMTFLFEHRQTMPSLNDVKDISTHIHITIIEEAHRLLSSANRNSGGGTDGTATQDSKAKSISLFIDMLAEIRAKGEGIFIVEQIPTKLISEAIKNTNLKIMHRITSKDDRNYLGEAMNMNEQQKNYVNNLKTGDAIIFEEQLDNPIFVKMNKVL